MSQDSTANAPQTRSSTAFSRFPFQKYCKVTDFLTGGLLALNWALPLYSLHNLPEKIPMQYSLTGAVSLYGSKYLMLMLPLSATINYFAAFYRTKEPQRMLYPVEAPVGNPHKTEKLGSILNRAVGVLTQTALLAGCVLLIKGFTLDKTSRAYSVRIGLIASFAAFATPYLVIRYLRDN